MLKTGFYEFFTHEDALLFGLIGLALILRNWWDLIRYGLRRAASGDALQVPVGRLQSRSRAARVPRALRRTAGRRPAIPRPIGHGHRPVTHAV